MSLAPTSSLFTPSLPHLLLSLYISLFLNIFSLTFWSAIPFSVAVPLTSHLCSFLLLSLCLSPSHSRSVSLLLSRAFSLRSRFSKQWVSPLAPREVLDRLEKLGYGVVGFAGPGQTLCWTCFRPGSHNPAGKEMKEGTARPISEASE